MAAKKKAKRQTLQILPYGAFNCRTSATRNLTPEERVVVCFRDLMRSMFRPQDYPVHLFITQPEACDWMRMAILNLNDPLVVAEAA